MFFHDSNDVHQFEFTNAEQYLPPLYLFLSLSLSLSLSISLVSFSLRPFCMNQISKMLLCSPPALASQTIFFFRLNLPSLLITFSSPLSLSHSSLTPPSHTQVIRVSPRILILIRTLKFKVELRGLLPKSRLYGAIDMEHPWSLISVICAWITSRSIDVAWFC
jgi:hypothetical protein